MTPSIKIPREVVENVYIALLSAGRSKYAIRHKLVPQALALLAPYLEGDE